MALSPYINEQTLTIAIKNNVPLNKQGTLTQIIATNTYSVEEGLYYYKIMATDGTNDYPVASATAASATTVAGVRFSGTEGTATFDITPTGEGFSYIARPISEFYGSINGEAKLANKIYGSAEGTTTTVSGEVTSGDIVSSFDGGVFWNRAASALTIGELGSLRITKPVRNTPAYSVQAISTTSESQSLLTGADVATMAEYGIFITDTTAYRTTTISTTVTHTTENVSKLIHQGFGHVDYSIRTWAEVQQVVQAGMAANYWSVGDEIDIACPWTDPSSGTTYNWVWVVADIGTTYKESEPNTAVPSMTLIAKYTTPNAYAFDAAEKVVATERNAENGVYYYGNNGSTYTKLSLSTGDTIPYGDYTAVYKNSVNMSSGYGVQYGYNNWELSNIRQWLNTAAAANSWFAPTHVGDSAPSYASQPGFLSGFSAEFQSILTPTRSGVSANAATDGGANYYTYDKMFLPSRYEVNLDTSLSHEGPVFALYTNAQNADRVKYRIDNQSSVNSWWLRSANRSTVGRGTIVGDSGMGSYSSASSSDRVAPACRIC